MARPLPPGILLAAFGTGTESGKAVLLGFTDRVREAYPGHTVRWAFTTGRTALRPALFGEPGLSVGEALSRFAGEKIPRVAVQPLHLTGGHEHESLRGRVAAWRESNPEAAVSVGPPLLTDTASMLAALDAMRRAGAARAALDETAVWVGHGNEPGQGQAYEELAALGKKKAPPVRVACLIHARAVEECIRELTEAGATKACLMPFFALAGNHTLRDLNGDAPSSWKSRLTAAGIACRVHLQGVAEHEAFAAIWLARLEDTLSRL